MAPYLGLRGTRLTIAIGLVSGLCFSLFGYDQADLGGLLTVDSFRAQFPQIDTIGNPGSGYVARVQGITVAAWNLGCILSAICTIWLGSYLGRRKTLFVGLSFLILGEVIQCSSYSLGQLIAGRVIAGFGNGFNTATVPAWQAESSRAHRRGMLVMITGTFIAFGVMLASWMTFAFAYLEPSSAAWRVPIGIQLAVAVLVLIMLIFLPESPRWLILNGKAEEALTVLAALDDANPDDAIVFKEFLAIKDAVIAAGATGGFGDVFTNKSTRHFHRTVLACLVQTFQQISGVNLIGQFLALLLLQQTHYAPYLARLLSACIATATIIPSLVPVVGIDRFWGRRSLMMFGATGMMVAMIILTIMRYLDTGSSNVVTAVFFFVFQAFFVIGWQGMAWLYSAEIVPLRIRAPANALSTGCNWIVNFLVVLITPIAFHNIGYRTYIIFAVCNAFIIPCVYFLFPETAFRTLEEVDVFFYAASKEKSPYFAVLKKSHEAPLWYGRDGQADFDYEHSDWHQRAMAQRSSDEASSSDYRSPGSSGDSDEKKNSSNGSANGLLNGNSPPEANSLLHDNSPPNESTPPSETTRFAYSRTLSSDTTGRPEVREPGRV